MYFICFQSIPGRSIIWLKEIAAPPESTPSGFPEHSEDFRFFHFSERPDIDRISDAAADARMGLHFQTGTGLR